MRSAMTRQRPNILWFISDDTSHGMLGYAGGRALSPNIDSVARSGVSFDNFFCVSPACAPSRYNYLTGRFGGRCPSVAEGATRHEPYNLFFNTHLDPAREQTVGHWLQRAGYRTGHVGKWHTYASAADVAAIPHIDRDADIHDPSVQARLKAQQEHLCALVRKAGFDHAHGVIWGNHQLLPKAVRNHNLEWITRGALDFIDGATRDNQPFFLCFAPTTIHAPNHVSSLRSDPRLTGGGIADGHLGSQASRSSIFERLERAEGVEMNSTTAGVLWMDDALGALLLRLRSLGIEDNTIVIVSTDHGPSDSRGGKFSVYDPGIRIPFCLQWKGHIAGDRRVGEFAQSIDLAPTLLELTGASPSAGTVLDGTSLLPLLKGEPRGGRRDDMYFEFGYARAVRTRRWKYIAWRPPPSVLDPIRDGRTDALCSCFGRSIPPEITRPTLLTPTLHNFPHYFAPDQLYDLERDPREKRNLAGDPEHAGTLAEMRSRLRERLSIFASPFPLEEPDPFFSSSRFEELKKALQERLARELPLWKKDAQQIGFLDSQGADSNP